MRRENNCNDLDTSCLKKGPSNSSRKDSQIKTDHPKRRKGPSFPRGPQNRRK